MAKIPAGILGRIIGKVGDVVGASWKGIPYIRQYVIPANPNTDAQKAERDLFRDIVYIAKTLLGPVLQVFWDPFLRQNSGWAQFIGETRKVYLEEGTYDNVLIARGTLEGSIITTAGYLGGNVSFVWGPTVLGNGSPDDAACVFVYDMENKVGFFQATDVRSDASSVLAVGAGRTVANLQAWLFFADSGTAPTKLSYSDWAQCIE